MKRIFTSFSFLFIICFSSQFVIAQSAGDYRTNFVGAVGSWSNIAIWETYNGVSWGPAAAYPTSADGVITISAGYSAIIKGGYSKSKNAQAIVASEYSIIDWNNRNANSI